jgi:hypothetical protein
MFYILIITSAPTSPFPFVALFATPIFGLQCTQIGVRTLYISMYWRLEYEGVPLKIKLKRTEIVDEICSPTLNCPAN